MTSKPIGKFLTGMFLWLSILAATGCDVSMPTPSSSSRSGDVRTEKLKTNLSAEEARELAKPASTTPGLSVDVQGAQNMGVGSENFDGTMQPSRGLNTKRLFGDRVGDNDERFERLENAVQQLRDDFDAVNPAINRLIAIEGEIQMLVDQLQVLVKDDDSAALEQIPPVSSQALDENEYPVEENPAPAAPVPLAPPLTQADVTDANAASLEEPIETVSPATATPIIPTVTPTTPAAVTSPVPSDAALLALRVADHEKTTRVVFETNKNLSYTVDVDPEKILIVTFREGASQANLSAGLKSSLVKSADQTPQAQGGFIVAMPLSKMTKIVRQGVLPPDGTNSRYRIYIDLEL